MFLDRANALGGEQCILQVPNDNPPCSLQNWPLIPKSPFAVSNWGATLSVHLWYQQHPYDCVSMYGVPESSPMIMSMSHLAQLTADGLYYSVFNCVIEPPDGRLHKCRYALGWSCVLLIPSVRTLDRGPQQHLQQFEINQINASDLWLALLVTGWLLFCMFQGGSYLFW